MWCNSERSHLSKSVEHLYSQVVTFFFAFSEILPFFLNLNLVGKYITVKVGKKPDMIYLGFSMLEDKWCP